MKYDLGSFLTRKRIGLEEFAARNNIKSVNDISMFILNNKTFDVSDELVQRLTELCTEKEPEAVEDMLIISPNLPAKEVAVPVASDEDESAAPQKRSFSKKSKSKAD